MKRSGFLKRKTPLRKQSQSTSALFKVQIQDTLRLLVTARDKGCILRDSRCGVTAELIDNKVVSNTVIQADHLITRSNSATYADHRLVVCLCKGCHGWKHWNEKEYDILVKRILSKDRVQLWERCEEERMSHRAVKMDWAMELLALKQQLRELSTDLSLDNSDRS